MATLDEKVKDYLTGKTVVPEGKKTVLCQVCGLFEPKSIVYDGSIESVLCDKCLNQSKRDGLAYLMCRKCGKFLGFYKPGVVKLESGVRVLVEPGDTLHTEWCGHCNPNEPRADVSEFKDIMKMKHLEAVKDSIVDRGKELKVEGV